MSYYNSQTNLTNLSDIAITDDLIINSLSTGLVGNSSGKLKTVSAGSGLIYDDNKSELRFDSTSLNDLSVNTITASTGYFTSGLTGSNGSFQILRAERLANLSNDNIYLKGVTTGEKLVSIPDGYPNTPFPNNVNQKDIAIGWRSGNLTSQEEKNRNITIGHRSGMALSSSTTDNVCIGHEAGFSLGSSTFPANESVLIGSNAGLFQKAGQNVMIGAGAGAYSIQNATGCVFIGYQAGAAGYTQSNQLVISNNGTDPNPLIYGEFDTKKLFVHNTIDAPTGIFDTVSAGTGYFNSMTASSGFINRANIVSYTGATGYLSAGLRTQNIQTIGNYFRVADDNGNRIMNLGTALADTLGIGNNAGKATGGDRNTWYGYNCGRDTTTAIQNSAVAWSACERITTGNYNNAQGTLALQFNQTGGANTCFGNGAGTSIFNTNNNTVFGNDSLRNGNTSVAGLEDNVCIGKEIMVNSLTNPTARNLCIGFQAMRGANGSDNVVIGYQQGLNAGSFSNKFLLHNSSNTFPLFSGDFATRKLTINANTIAFGLNSGQFSQGTFAVAIGQQAGRYNQTQYGIAVGQEAGWTGQREDAIAIGRWAGYSVQATGAISIGHQAGEFGQGTNSIAIGVEACATNQGAYSIAIGNLAGSSSQKPQAIAIGYNAANNQSTGSVAIGYFSGANSGTQSVAVGYQAGFNNMGQFSIAIGRDAGYQDQFPNSIAIGYQSGQNSQGGSSIAIGVSAGRLTQGGSSVAIGDNTAVNGQGGNSVAIGAYAGNTNQGAYSVAIGALAGSTNQPSNSIAINGSSNPLSVLTNGLFINPVRQDNTKVDNPLTYTTDKEIVQTNFIKCSITGPSSCFFDSEVINLLKAPEMTGSNAVFGGKVTAGQFTGATGIFSSGVGTPSITGANMFISGVLTGASGFFGNIQMGDTDVVSKLYVKAPASGDYRVPISMYRTTTTADDVLFRCYSDVTSTKKEWFRVEADGKIRFGTNLLQLNESTATINGLAGALRIYKVGVWDCGVNAGGVANLSDRRFKKDIEYLTDNHLETIQKLRPCKYIFSSMPDNTQKQLGFIAQEVREVYPEMISENEDGTLLLNYQNFSVLAIQAIKELSAKVENLEKRLLSLVK